MSAAVDHKTGQEKMDCELSNIKVLIVDHDDVYLAFLTNILMAWQYKVVTAKDARHALVTLQENEGLLDLVITEFHLVGMNGLEFQKHIKDQFQIPIIIMSEDNRPSLISKTLENGAAQYIVKPFCAEDFKDIWKHVMEAKKEKLFIESLFVRSEEEETSSEPKNKKNHCKRKSKECQGERDIQVVKKQKLVWTPYLHKMFLLAINQIGLEKVVPKKILEIMNIPNLTRENVASHLQKYRIFLRDVEEKGMVGGISHRSLRSSFASGLPSSVIREIEEKRTNKLHAPTHQYLQTLANQTRGANNVFHHFNQIPKHHVDQFPYFQKGLALQDLVQVRLGKSKLEADVVAENNGPGQNRFGISSSNLPSFQAKNSFHDGASTSFSSYKGEQGLRVSSSSSFLTRDFKFGDVRNQNHGVKNSNFGSLISTNVMPHKFTSDVRNNNTFGIQLNNGAEMVGIGTMNNGLRASSANNNERGQNVNMNFRSFVNENFGFLQGGFGLDSISNIRGGSGKEFLAESVNNEGNVSKNRQFPQHKLDGYVVENEQNFNGSTFTNEVEFNKIEFNNSDFLMADDKNHRNEIYKSGDDISPQVEITSCVLNESPINSIQNSQLQGNEGFSNGEPSNRFLEGKVSKASTSATNLEFDMDLVEALFGTIED